MIGNDLLLDTSRLWSPDIGVILSISDIKSHVIVEILKYLKSPGDWKNGQLKVLRFIDGEERRGEERRGEERR